MTIPTESHRKTRYLRRLIGELEAYTYYSIDTWREKEFETAFDLIEGLLNELEAAHDEFFDEMAEFKAESETAPAPDNHELTPCILCGKMTPGSIGKAGIRWKMICQECKDREDSGLDNSMRSIKKLVNMVDGLAGWLGE